MIRQVQRGVYSRTEVCVCVCVKVESNKKRGEEQDFRGAKKSHSVPYLSLRRISSFFLVFDVCARS